MSKTPQTGEELRAHLEAQVSFLKLSAEAFDRGYDDEARRLAVSIRVLVHDTKVSHSLLSQLGMKHQLLFHNSASPINPKNILTESSLVEIQFGPNGTRFRPHLDDPPSGASKTPFDQWWKQPVVRDKYRKLFTRADLVLTTANQAGGAHVDPTLDEGYAQLTRDNTMAWVARSTEGSHPILGVELASIRQIAHEILKTLQPSCSAFPEAPVQSAGGGANPGISQTAALPLFGVGRNEPCPCGSGKKYKKCHARLI